MNNPNLEQLAAAQQANIEVMTALLRTAFNGVERLTALNMSATREFLQNTVAGTQQLMAAKDAGEIAKLNSELAKPSVDKLMEYSRSLYDLVAEITEANVAAATNATVKAVGATAAATKKK